MYKVWSGDYILLRILVLLILYGVYSSFFKKKSTL